MLIIFVQENPAYAKFRDKPFPTYKDIEVLSGTSTAVGQFGMSSLMTTQTIDSSSLSSLCEDDTVVGVRQLAINFLPDVFEPGFSRSPLHANVLGSNTSRSPSPPLVQPNIRGSASGSRHSSAGKRPCSPDASVPPKN